MSSFRSGRAGREGAGNGAHNQFVHPPAMHAATLGARPAVASVEALRLSGAGPRPRRRRVAARAALGGGAELFAGDAHASILRSLIERSDRVVTGADAVELARQQVVQLAAALQAAAADGVGTVSTAALKEQAAALAASLQQAASTGDTDGLREQAARLAASVQAAASGVDAAALQERAARLAASVQAAAAGGLDSAGLSEHAATLAAAARASTPGAARYAGQVAAGAAGEAAAALRAARDAAEALAAAAAGFDILHGAPLANFALIATALVFAYALGAVTPRQ